MAQITADTSGVHPVVTLTGGRVGIQFKSSSSRITAQAIGSEQQSFIVQCNGICCLTLILLACLAGQTAVASDEG